jgi:hypothetical protein
MRMRTHSLPLMRIHRTAFSLQDGASCCKTFLKQSERQFNILDWLGNSPDLNPIENCWSYMKRKLNANRDITSLPSWWRPSS